MDKRLLSRITSIILLITMVASMILPGIAPVAAQESTAEAPVETTQEPTPIESTDPVPTDPPPVVIPPSTQPTSFVTNFDTGDLTGWLLSPGWTWNEAGYLTTSGPGETATVNGILWEDFSLSAALNVQPDSAANIGLRVGADSYTVQLSADGIASLYRSGLLLAQGPVPDIEATPEVSPVWRSVSVTLTGGTIAVAVDGTVQITYTDPAPLPAGLVVFSNSTGTVLLDNVSILTSQTPVTDEPTPIVIPPQPPTDTPTQPPVVVTEQTPVVIPPVEETPVETEIVVTEQTPVVIPPVEETPIETDETEIVVTEQTPVVIPPVEETPVVVEPEETPVVVAPEVTPDVETTPIVVEPEVTPGIETTSVVVAPEVTPEIETTPDVVAPEVTSEAESTPDVIEPEVTPEAESTPDVVEPEVTPEAEITPDVVAPEVTPEAEPESGLTAILSADFEGDVTGWNMSEGAAVVTLEDNNVLQLNSDMLLIPAETLVLADQRIEARVQGELAIAFRSGENGRSYLLSFDTTETRLYRNAGDGYETLLTVPAERTPDTWYALSLQALGKSISLSVDGVVELAYQDETPLLAGTLSFIASGDNVLLDDVAIYDLTPDGESNDTPVPTVIDDETRAKFNSRIVEIIETFNESGLEAALAQANEYKFFMDDNNRLRVVVWKSADVAIETLSTLVEQTGGVVEVIEPDYIEAYIPFDSLIPLAALNEVRAITRPVVASSTSTNRSEQPAVLQAGTVIPHSLDVIGANTWHQIGYQGQNIDVAVIDVGFAAAGNAADQTCVQGAIWGGGPGASPHGTEVAEVICDVAPQARVYRYYAPLSGDVPAAITAAVNAGSEVIVVALDAADTSGLDNALTLARNNHIPVIASAGNTGGSSSVTFNSNTKSGVKTRVTVVIGDKLNGDRILDVDQTGTPNTFNVYVDGTFIESSPAIPDYTYDFDDDCGTSCQIIVEFTSNNNAEVTIAETASTIILDDTVTPVRDSSSLTAIAANENVIAVGAACASPSAHYPLELTSSTGLASQPNNANIKPEVVGPASIDTSITGLGGGDLCASGFAGTSAATAHVGGMVALLMSNNNMVGIYGKPAGTAEAVEQYLMSRAIDVTADGYDHAYGAGMVQLGDPTFNLNNQRTTNRDASDYAGTSNEIYVSSAYFPTTGEPDGSSTNPYTSAEFAMQQARFGVADTVVLMPGEYVSPIRVSDGVSLVAFNAVDEAGTNPSRIWVNDTFGGDAGISISDINNLTIQGLVFNGSTPLYAWSQSNQALGDVTPISITNASNINLLDNTFTDFDRPLTILTSSDILLRNNVFDSFIISNVGAAPAYPAAAVLIQGSTNLGDVNHVTIERNIFSNNYVGRTSSPAGTKLYEGVIRIVRAQVDINGSRFLNNSSATVIGVDQWTNRASLIKKSTPVTVFSSLFDGNITIGPFVHLYQNNRFLFINNTVVNNTMGQTSLYPAYIAVGHVFEDSAIIFDEIGDHRWDIHNNLFYNNSTLQLINRPTGIDTFPAPLCASTVGGSGDHTGARNNWFTNVNQQGGYCNVAIGSAAAPANDNIFDDGDWGTIDYDLTSQAGRDAFEADYFFNNNDANHPYRLRPALDQGAGFVNLGIDTGDDSMADIALTQLGITRPNALDARNGRRFIDQDALTTAYEQIDIGAYESTEIPTVQVVDESAAVGDEDDPYIAIPLNDRVDDGFEPYTFVITDTPAIYDPDPNNDCFGQAIYLVPKTSTALYCPPANFHTAPADIDISFSFRVNGALRPDISDADTGTIPLTVNPMDDGQPASSAETHIVYTDYNTPINVPLRPFVEIGTTLNFSDDEKDYDFIFDTFAVDIGAPDWNSALLPGGTGNFEATYIQDGHLVYDPPTGEIGAFEFTYAVADQDQPANFSGSRRMRVVVRERIAGPGIYDDTALDIRYSDGWAPWYQTGAYQSTIHYSIGSDRTAEIDFLGDTFIVNYYSYTNAADFQVEIDLNGDGNFQNIFTSGLYCSDDGIKPVNVIAGDRGAQGVYSIGCSGAEDSIYSQTLKTLRITALGTDFSLDSIEIRSGLQISTVYQQDTIDLRYSEGDWLPWTEPGILGGTLMYNTNANATMTFKIDTTGMEDLLIYYPAANWMGTMEVCRNTNDNCVRRNLQNLGPKNNNDVWVLGRDELGLPANSKATITVRPVSGYAAVSAVQLRPPFTTGTVYQASNLAITYVDDWYRWTEAGVEGGSYMYADEDGAEAKFTVNTSGMEYIVVYLPTDSWMGTMEICRNENEYCQRRNFTVTEKDNDDYWIIHKDQLGLVNSYENVTIRKVSGAYGAISAVELVTELDPLTVSGGIYQDDAPNFLYNNGFWWRWYDAGLEGGSVYTTNINAARMTFRVDSTGMENLVIHYPAANWMGTMKVCRNLNDNCQTRNLYSTSNDNHAQWVIDKASLGLSGGIETITISKTSGDYIAVSAIELIGHTEPLTVGPPVEETDERIVLGGEWVYWQNVNTYGGSAVYTADPNATMRFRVDTTNMADLVIYTTQDPSTGELEICRNTNDNCQVIDTQYVSGTLYQEKLVISKAALGLADNSEETITIRRLTRYPTISGIQVRPTIVVGSIYQEDHPALTYQSTQWASWDDPGSTGGRYMYTNDIGGSMNFTIDTTGMDELTLFTVTDSWMGTMEVCANDGADCVQQNFAGPVNPDVPWAITKAQLNLSNNAHETITLSLINGQAAVVSGIQLTGTPDVLVVGPIYQEDTGSFIYSEDDWIPWVESGLRGGSLMYPKDPNGSATLEFRINPTGMRDLVIYAPSVNWMGTMQVCNGTTCVSKNFNSAVKRNDDAWIIPREDLGLITDAVTTLILKQVNGYAAVSAIQLRPSLSVGLVYEEDAPGLTYTSVQGWAFWNEAGLTGGDGAYTDTVNDSVSFTVDTTGMNYIKIHAPTGWWMGTMKICRTGTTSCKIRNFNASKIDNDNYWLIVKSELGLTETYESVTLSMLGGSYAAITAIELLANLEPMTIAGGFYNDDAPNFHYAGSNWLRWYEAGLQGESSLQYTDDVNKNVTFRVDTTNGMENIIVHAPEVNWMGTMELCANNSTNCISKNFYSTVKNNAATWTVHRDTLNLTDNIETLNLRYTGVPANLFGSISGIEIAGKTPAITAGAPIEETDSRIVYAGNWIKWNSAATYGGSAIYSGDTSATMRFTIDTTGMGDLVIYHFRSPETGSIQICRESNFNCANYDLRNLSALHFQEKLVISKAELGLPDNAEATITIRPVSGEPTIEAIQVRPALVAGGVYQETAPELTFSGRDWLPDTYPVVQGGSYFYTADTSADMTFTVNTTGMQSLIVYAPQDTWMGTMQVCANGGLNCQTKNFNGSKVNDTRWTLTKADLGLTDTLESITLRLLSGQYAAVAAIGVSPTSLSDWQPGYYEDTDFGLQTSGTWVPGADADITTTSDGSYLEFDIANNTTGFVVYTTRTSNAADMQVCYKAKADGNNICTGPNSFSEIVSTSSGSKQINYGYSYFGLPAGTAYTVRITHDGTNGQPLAVSGFSVLGQPGSPINNELVDNTDNRILYAAPTSWQSSSSSSYYAGTLAYSPNVGSLALLEIEGNAMTIYNTVASSSSSLVRVCVVVSTGIQPEISCVNLTQNSGTTEFQIPTTLYGLGDGTHQIIIENQNYNKNLTIDAIRAD